MKETSDTNAGAVLQALASRGTPLYTWAPAHGYQRRTVYQTVHRWAGRTDKYPHGGIARQIMADLRKDLGTELIPEPAIAPPELEVA